MKNKIKKILLLILFISLTFIKINKVFAADTYVLPGHSGVCEEVGSATPSIVGWADVSDAVERTIGSNLSGSNFYSFSGTRGVCYTASKSTPRISGKIYECKNNSVYSGARDGLTSLGGYTYEQIARSLTSYTISKTGNDYIIGHAILSCVLGDDCGVYSQLYSNIAIRELVNSFVSGLSISTERNIPYYIYVPSNDSTQSLVMLTKPPITQNYGGIAIQKYVNGSSSGDLSGYQFQLYKGSCSGEYINTFTTNSSGIVEYWGEGGSSSNPKLEIGSTYCFKEVVDGNGYALKNGQSTEFKPAGDVTVSANSNPKAASLIGRMDNNNTTSGKGYIVINKTVTSKTGSIEPLNGYIFTIYHSSCDNLQNRVAQLATNDSGYVTYGYNVSTSEGVLDLNDIYCVNEEVSPETGKAYRNIGEGGAWVESDFKPTTNPIQVKVNGGANFANYENREEDSGGDDYCLNIKKYMENDDASLEILRNVPFILKWNYFDGSTNEQKSISLGTSLTNQDGIASWEWGGNYLPVQTYTPGGPYIRDFTITEGTNNRRTAWAIYQRQDGQNTPYLYAIGPIGTSGPEIHEMLFGDIKEQWASLCSNNFGYGCGYDQVGSLGDRMPTCSERTPLEQTPKDNIMVELVDTKVYFCLRVKKEDENGEIIDPEAFDDMIFEASGNGRTIRTTDTSLSRINKNTGVVSFFTGDSIDTGVNVVPYGFFGTDKNDPDAQEICTRGNLCNDGPDRLIPVTWQVREISAPTGYTLNTETVLNVKPIQMKAYMFDREISAYERAKEDCLSGADDKGETFTDYPLNEDETMFLNAPNYTTINSLTVNNSDANERDKYIIKNKKLVLQWFKRAVDDTDTVPNDAAQLNGAKFIARRADGGVDGKAYAKIKDTNNDGSITLADRQTTKDSNGVSKLCYVTDGYQATAPTTYMESGDVSVNQDGSMDGEVCLANVNASRTNLNYIITEIDSADSHTIGLSNEKTIAATKTFVSRTDSNTIFNYSTEFEFEKKVTVTDEYTVEELTKISFSIFRQNDQGQATGDPITLKVAGNGVYDYLRGNNPTTILHVALNNSNKLKFVVKHLPKGKYIVKEIVGSTCEDNTDPTTCVGYYMPSANDQRFTITKCSNKDAQGCGSGNYRREYSTIMNKPTLIKFTKSDFYHEFDAGDVAEQGNNVPAEFANDKERSDFDRIVFTLYDKDGTPLKLKFVGNHGDCNSDSDYAEYRYVRGGTEGSTELHTCGGHIRITHLCRGKTYTVKEESVPDNSVFVRENTDSTPISQTYNVACNEGDSSRPTTETKLIVDKPTRVTFEKRDAKYNYLIPDETTTFEVYQCKKGTTCHPGDYSSVEAREAHNMKLVKFSARAVISGDEEDNGIEVYKYMSFSDAQSKSKCQGNNTNNCYVTKVHPYNGKLVFRYLPAGYNYVLLETVAPKNYLLPEGEQAETAFTVRKDTVDVDYIDVPNQPTGIIIRKYDEEGRLLGGAKFRVKQVTNYNPNKKAQDQEAVELKFKTIKQGVYEYRPVLDSNLVITCEGIECSNTDAFSYDRDWSNFDTLITSSGEKVKDVLKEGTAIIQYLEYDNYYVIEEVEAPKGYSLPEKEDDRFTLIHIGKNTTIIEDTEMKFVNYPTPYTFYKFDEYNNLLDGAKFKLQKLNDNKSYVTLNVSKVEGEDSLYKVDPESSNDIIETTGGKASVYYLEEGQYRIVEVEAPAGKELPKKTINVATFFVDKEGKVFGENIITNKAPTEKKYVKPEAQASLIINIQTGQNVVKYGLIIATLIAAITGLMIFMKKRK